MRSAQPYRLLYDGDCRICSATARGLILLDVRRRLRAQTIQDSRGLLGGVPANEVLEAMHIVDPEGRVATGGDSMPVLLEALFSGPPLAALLRRSRALRVSCRALYRVAAGLRGHLICRVEPSVDPSPSPPP